MRNSPKNYSCTAKTAGKKSCRGSHGKKVEQVLSTIQVLFLMIKKIRAQAITNEKIKHKLSGLYLTKKPRSELRNLVPRVYSAFKMAAEGGEDPGTHR